MSNPKRSRFCLSAKNGGLGILNPVAKASEQFEMSKKTTFLISDSILRGTKLDIDAHKTHVRSSKQNLINSNKTFNTNTVKFINTYNGSLEQACTSHRNKMECNCKTGKCQRERERERERRERERPLYFIEDRIPGFNDVKIRFTLKNLPVECDGCGEDFHVQYALTCKN